MTTGEIENFQAIQVKLNDVILETLSSIKKRLDKLEEVDNKQNKCANGCT